MRQARRLVGAAILALLATLVTAGTAFAPPPACDLTQLQLRDSTVNQGLGSYDRLVRGKETLVRMFFSMPSCHDNNDQVQVTAGSLDVSGAGTTLATGIVGTPTPVSTFPTAATYATAPLNDAPADIKFVVAGSALATSATTDAYTASFTAQVTIRTKTSAAAPLSGPVVRTFTAFATKTVERPTNALRILVVPMGNTANSYSTEFPAEAVASVENGMQTLARLFPVPDGVGTLGGSTGGIRYAIDSTLLNVTTPFCGDGLNFDAIKAELAQFLVSWNAANPSAQADRVVGAVAGSNSLGSDQNCGEGMASLNSPESWVRAFPDSTNSPSMTGALVAMEVAHTFGLTPAARSFSTFHSLNTAADGTSPNRGYNTATRSFLADDRTALRFSGTWNNNTTLLEKEDYAFLICVLGGQTNTECLNANVADSAGGVAAVGEYFALTGTTNNTQAGTDVEESFKTGNLLELGLDPDSDYRLVQRVGDAVAQTDRVHVSFRESHHDDASPEHTAPKGTFAAVVPLIGTATKFELWRGAVGTGTLLWSTLKTAPPTIESFTATASGVENYSQSQIMESDPALSDDAQWVAWSDFRGVRIGPRSDYGQGMTAPQPALEGRNGRILFVRNADIYSMTPGSAAEPLLVISGGTQPEWSPDRSEIAFSRNGDIWVASSNGADARQLTEDSAVEDNPTWAPDGRIAYVKRTAGTYDIWAMQYDGSGETQLTNTPSALEDRPSWSPVGDMIAFASTSSGQWRLYTMAPDGSNVTQLSDSVDGDLNPEFSPTGNSLAFYGDGGNGTVDLFVAGLDGDSRSQVTNTDNLQEFDPAWSGDGNALVFMSSPDGVFDGGFEVEVIDVNGENRQNLTSNENLDDVYPDWENARPSADDPALVGSGGKASLAYVIDGDIYMVPLNLAGAAPVFGAVTQLYDANGDNIPNASGPTWKPDATQLAFSADTSIWLLEPGRAGALTQLTSPDAFPGDIEPSWSRTAGSNAIVFERDEGSGGDSLWTVDPAQPMGEGLLLANGFQPSWGTDGRIAFARSGEVSSEVWEFEPGDPGVERKVFDGGFDPALVGETFAFLRNFPPPVGQEFGQNDIMIGVPGSGISIDAVVKDEDSEDLLLDVLVDCGQLVYVAAVARDPESVVGDISTWELNYDPSLTCTNPEIKIAVSDGYNRVTSDDGQEVASEQKPPTAAIYSPSPGAVFDQYDLVPARGSGWDPEDGSLTSLAWTLTKVAGPGDAYSATGSSQVADFSPPAGGFPLGTYELKLTVTDSVPNSDSATRTFTIVGDNDNDGLTDEEELLTCITFDAEAGSAAADPLNAFRDDDLDGIVNVDDPEPCEAALEYEATIQFDPNEMQLGSQGALTARVTIPNRDMKDVSMAYIKSINAIDTSDRDDLRATQWLVARGTNVGQAKFDRAALNAFFLEHAISGQSVRVVVAGTGGSGAATWTFEGVGTLLVR